MAPQRIESASYFDEQHFIDVSSNSHDDAPKFTLDFTAASKYVLRSTIQVDGPVLQPYAQVQWQGFNAVVWSNYALTNENYYPTTADIKYKFTEIDFIFEYAYKWNKLTITPGFIHLELPNTGIEQTTRIYITTAYDIYLQPSLNWTLDLHTIKGWELNFYLNPVIKDVWKSCWGSLNIECQGTISYRSANFTRAFYGVHKDAFTDASVGLRFPFSFMHGWLLAPWVHASVLVDHEVRKASRHNDQLFWYGADLSYSF